MTNFARAISDSPFSLRNYTSRDEALWEQFVNKADNATFLHSRKFLSYHGTRFQDASIIISDKRDRIVGLMPAAISPQSLFHIVSHPGATFGGIVHCGQLSAQAMLDLFFQLFKYLENLGYEQLSYKSVPYIYHQRPSEDDLYGFFRYGIQATRCDLSATIDLSSPIRPSSRRKKALKKALDHNLIVDTGLHNLGEFWSVLQGNLKKKHNKDPVHLLSEISELCLRFPTEIITKCIRQANEIVAGVILFDSPMVCHAQYIAANERGYELSALDLLFTHCIAFAKERSRRFFDFGVSTESGGHFLNVGLDTFKREFGSGSCIYSTYTVNLKNQ